MKEFEADMGFRARLVYTLFVAVASLPFFFWYALSDLLAFVLRVVLKYRRDVIAENLRSSFPEKGAEELERIHRQFYRNFCDTLVESIKLGGLSRRAFEKRIHCTNPQVFEALKAQNRSVIAMEGHFANWEWPGVHICCDYSFFNLVIFQPFNNKVFGRVLYELRYRLPTRRSGWLTPAKDTVRNMIKAPQPNRTVMLADQSPSRTAFVRVPFLNRDTAFWNGPARISQKLKLALVFVKPRRLKRGYFEYSLELLCEDASQWSEEQVTAAYASALEKAIRESPADWLWSHKRWKF